MFKKDTIQSAQYAFSAVDLDGVKQLTEPALDYRYWKADGTDFINFYTNISFPELTQIDYIRQSYAGATDYSDGDPYGYIYFTEPNTSSATTIIKDRLVMSTRFLDSSVEFEWQGSLLIPAGVHRMWVETQARSSGGPFTMSFLMRGKYIASSPETLAIFEF